MSEPVVVPPSVSAKPPQTVASPALPSTAVSVLKGAAHQGFAEVREAGLVGMIQIRADLASPGLRAALSGLGYDLPQPREVRSPDGGGSSSGAAGLNGLAWMSPDELLLFCDYAEAARRARDLAERLEAEHALVLDVSDMRAVFRLSGARAAEVVMKLCPVDVATLPAMELRRTRAAQTAVALWRSGEAELTLICMRSVAGYVLGLLEVAARRGGEIFPG